MIEYKGRETGICPIREELYGQCFDEINRQVAISCNERGYLLKRIRDHYKNTINLNKSIYESSMGHGMRKCLKLESFK
jgi:dynein light intermediate chain